jgi:hypothetical protein
MAPTSVIAVDAACPANRPTEIESRPVRPTIASRRLPETIRRMAQLVRDRHPDYLRIAQEVSAFSDELLTVWPAAKREEGGLNPLSTMVYATFQAQVSRLDALLALDAQGLAHVGTPFVRLGYEEFLWLYYFALKVPVARRPKLLATLASVDVIQRFRTQDGYTGRDGRPLFGFTEATATQIEAQVEQVRTDLQSFRAQFGWNDPRNPRSLQLPGLAELSRLLGMPTERHAYLGSAPSQFMHFSAWRQWRQVETGPDGKANPRSPTAERRDATYALGWVANSLLNVLVLVETVLPDLAGQLYEVAPHFALRARHLIKRIDDAGPPPLIEAHELEARNDQQQG